MTSDGPSAGWLDEREHVLPVRIYYEDTDFSGVVYHGAYVRFLERGRTEFLRLAGVSHSGLLARPERSMQAASTAAWAISSASRRIRWRICSRGPLAAS